MYVYINIYREKEKERLKKQNNPKFDEFIMKVNVEHFSCNNLIQDFKFMKNFKIAMDV